MIRSDLLHRTIFFVNKDLIDHSKQASLHKIQWMIMIDSNNSLQDSIKEVAAEIFAFVPLFE